MATTRKRASKKPVGPPADRTPSEEAAHAIIASYSDLAPSVNRILNAPLTERGKMHAITLFRESLGMQGDPMRDPANAVAAGLLVDENPS